jgi:hypothetical protein
MAAEPLNLSRYLNDSGVRAFVQTGAPSRPLNTIKRYSDEPLQALVVQV